MRYTLKSTCDNLFDHNDEMDIQIARFCNQYLQLEQKLDYPDPAVLREETTQESIYGRLFGSSSPRFKPPPRYQLRFLKELVRRVEDSIDDWDLYVRI